MGLLFSNNGISDISGVRVISSLSLVQPGESYQEKRTWKERLFTKPWTPQKKFKTVTPMIPMKDIFRLPDGTLVMHPLVLDAIKKGIISIR